MINLAIFASGNGSNAENIIRHFQNDSDIKVKLVVSNNSNAYVHTRAKQLGVESVTFSKASFDTCESVLAVLKQYHIDFIVLAGFMLKIPRLLIDAYPFKIVNIHPALLPKYGGKGMYGDHVHRAVVSAHEVESGITIHYLNENYDEGNIIFQAKCTINPEDTYEDVAKKVHTLEYEYYPVVIEEVVRQTYGLREEKTKTS
jgi:phosphoribosylglycinamide formyltransferase-1